MDAVSETPTKPVDYALLSVAYAGAATVLAVAGRARSPQLREWEIVPIGLASFALAKLVAKEKVESWIRVPFLEELPSGQRRPKGRRMRFAIGELLSCTRCVGAWSSLAVLGVRVSRPHEARVLVLVLGASTVNDFLQAGFTRLCAEANLSQQRAGAPPPEASERDGAMAAGRPD